MAGHFTFSLPTGQASPEIAAPAPAATTRPAGLQILSDIEFRQRERDNVLAALNKTNWKIHGSGGAAELLGLKPTTLVARIKRFGLKKEVHGAIPASPATGETSSAAASL